MIQSVEEIDIAKLANREHEVFTHIVGFDAWQECQHGKQLVTVMAHWSDDKPGPPVTTGCRNSTQRFTRTVHVDGTVAGGEFWHDCYGVHQKCPECGELDTLKTEQMAYGDDTTCTTDGCNYHNYYSIGD